MRAYLVAFGLVALVVGLPILLLGYVRVGCSVASSGGNVVYSNCAGADSLELAGAVLVVAALILFAASAIPNDQSRYK